MTNELTTTNTAIEKLSVEELQARLRIAEELTELLLTRNPDGIVIQDLDGSMTVNPAALALTSVSADEAPQDYEAIKAGQAIQFFREDGVTPFPPEEHPQVRALRGEEVRGEIMVLRTPRNPGGVAIECNATSIDGGRRAINIFRDVTDRKRLEADLARRNAELSQKGEENQRLVDRLRVALDQLSTPVLELWDDVLALPVIGIVDTQRSVQMAEKLLKEVSESGARHVIVDLTGVDVVDTSTADRLIKLSRAVSLLGAECVLTGIQPEVAQTLIELGVEMGGLRTQRNLKHALVAFLQRSRDKALTPAAD